MTWENSLNRLLESGSRVLILHGAATEQVPNPDAKVEETPLRSVREAVQDIWQTPPYLIIRFDLARGFRFDTDAHEKAFRAVTQPTESPSLPPAVAAARQQVQETAPLPSDPTEALLLIEQTLQALAKQQKSCLVFLEHAETLCPHAQTPVDRASKCASILLQEFAVNDTLRRAGHALILLTASLQSLDESLRRSGSPIRSVAISRPTESERLEFLQFLCPDSFKDTPDPLRMRRQKIVAHIERLEKDLLAQCDAELAQLATKQEQLGDVSAALTKDEKLGELHVKLEAHLKKQKKSAHGVEKEITRLDASIIEMERALETEAHLQTRKGLSWAVVKSLGVGSSLHLTENGQLREKTILEVRNTEEEKYFTLSLSTDQTKPQLSSVHVPIQFFWEEGVFCARPRSGSAGQLAPWSTAQITLIPRARMDLLVQVEAHKVELRNLRNNSKKITDPDRKELDGKIATRRCKVEEHHRAALKGLEEQRSEIQQRRSQPNSARLTEFRKELADIANQIEAQSRSQRFATPSMGLARLARLTQGFGYRDLFELHSMARAEQQPLTESTLATKRLQILTQSYGHLLEIVEPSYGFEGVAGLDPIKQHFRTIRDHILAGDLRNVPMGCLLMGPPGVGKTAIAEAFARECGFLFVKLQNMRSMWVGESEKQITQALDALRELAPVVVLRDEVDEEDTGRDSFQGDSGVSGRIRRQWMTFLSDPTIRGNVFVISCTNRPDRIDAALKRSGRTDDRIPILMPDLETRVALFQVMIARYQFPTDVKDFSTFASMTDGRSGADIEVMVRRAFHFAANRGVPHIDAASLREAVDDFIPSASTAEIKRMTLRAIQETSSRRFLPSGTKIEETKEIEVIALVEQITPNETDPKEVN